MTGQNKILVAWFKQLFQLVCNSFPKTGGCIAYWLWFQTNRRNRHPGELMLVKKAKRRIFRVNNKKVIEFVWGTFGKKILLIHGWGSHATHFSIYIQALRKAGYKVISMDLPAHGESSGWRTDFHEVTKAIEKVANRHSHFEAIITHSFGSAPVSYLLKAKLLQTRCLIMLSPLADYQYLFEKFTEKLAIKDVGKKVMMGKLEKKFGSDMWRNFAPIHNFTNITVPTFIIHDKDDRTVPVSHGEQIFRLLEKSIFLKTEGLGHHRALLSPSTKASIMNFLRYVQTGGPGTSKFQITLTGRSDYLLKGGSSEIIRNQRDC